MKNTFSILIILLCSTTLFAQKIKVKNGKILVDNVEVGIIEAINKSDIIYAVKDLSGKDLMQIDVDIAEGSTRPFEFNWMTVSSKDSPQINVVDYSMISMSLSHPKIIAEILTKTYGIFSKNGLNKDKITEFFAEERTSKYKEDSTGSEGVAMEGINEGFEGKIRVKGGDILFDKAVVAQIKQNEYKYTLTASNTKDKLHVEYLSTPLAGSDEILRWLVIGDNKKRKTEVKMEYLSGNVKNSRAIAELLSKKYNLITPNGIENLDEFFSVDRKSLTEEYRIVFNEAKEAYLKAEALIRFKIEEEKRGSLTSNIEKGLIYIKESGKQIGTVETLKGINPTDEKFYVIILDKSNNQIAKITSMHESDRKEFFLVGFDKKRHVVNLEGDTSFSKPQFYRSLARILAENGYGHAVEFGIERAKEMAIEEYYAKSKEAGNLLSASGYMMTSKGEKRNGLITLYFKYVTIPEGVEDNEKNTILARVDGKKIGKQFRFQTALGTDGSAYKARDNRGFCVYLEDGGEKCYVGKKIGTAEYGFVETDALEPGN